MINCTLRCARCSSALNRPPSAVDRFALRLKQGDSRPLRRRTIAHRPVAGSHPFDVGVALGDQISPYRATASRQIPIAA